MGVIQLVATFGRDQRDVGSVAAQEKCFVVTPIARAEHRDPPVGHLISVADRAIAQPTVVKRLLMCRVIQHRGTPVDHARGEQDRARGDGAAVHQGDEPVALARYAVDASLAQICIIQAHLLAHSCQQVIPRNAIGKSCMVAGQRDKAGATLPRIDHDDRQVESRQIYCGGQPGRPAADDKTVQRR